MKSAKGIRKELARSIRNKHLFCETEQEKNKAVNEARNEINTKYGHGWREDPARNPQAKVVHIYDGHTFGEHWMD